VDFQLIQTLPDVTPFLDKGILGGLVFIVVAGMVIAAYVVLKIVNKNGRGVKSLNGNVTQQATALREAQRQLDEFKAGNKPVQFWIDAYENSANKAIQPLLKAHEETLRTMREIQESQRRIRVRLKIDDED